MRIAPALAAATLLTACGTDSTVPPAATPSETQATDDAPSTTTDDVAPPRPATAPTTTDRTGGDTQPTEPVLATTPEKTTMPPTPDPTVPPAVSDGDVVQAAIADLSGRLDVDGSDIDVVSVDEVDWPDGSIGCPQPGMVYTQAIVNGSKIVLRHDGVDYAYHQGGARAAFYCPSDVAGRTTAPPPGDLDI